MDLIVNIAGLLLFGFALFLLPQHWRHENKTLDKEPVWWLWGKQLWDGWIRWGAVATVMMFVLALFFFHNGDI